MSSAAAKNITSDKKLVQEIWEQNELQLKILKKLKKASCRNVGMSSASAKNITSYKNALYRNVGTNCRSKY
jgi:hypothetical protein